MTSARVERGSDVYDLHGAGGIGALLAVDVQSADPDTTESGGFWYCFDANGNVMQLVAGANGYGGATGDEWHADRLKARYEYDPYGNLANTPSTFGMTNPYRFSTKYWVDQFGMGDWGHRWYDPRVGRWITNDPAGSLGGINLYCCVRNALTTYTDYLGLQRNPFSCLQPATSQPNVPDCETDNVFCKVVCTAGANGGARCLQAPAEKPCPGPCVCLCPDNIEQETKKAVPQLPADEWQRLKDTRTYP